MLVDGVAVVAVDDVLRLVVSVLLDVCCIFAGGVDELEDDLVLEHLVLVDAWIGELLHPVEVIERRPLPHVVLDARLLLACDLVPLPSQIISLHSSDKELHLAVDLLDEVVAEAECNIATINVDVSSLLDLEQLVGDAIAHVQDYVFEVQRLQFKHVDILRQFDDVSVLSLRHGDFLELEYEDVVFVAHEDEDDGLALLLHPQRGLLLLGPVLLLSLILPVLP